MKRAFSLYDIEQFLKEVGAERVSENAITTLEKELEDTLRELVVEAEIYANHAGRRMVQSSDVALVNVAKLNDHRILFNGIRNVKRKRRRKRELRLVQSDGASTIPNASSTNPISMSHI